MVYYMNKRIIFLIAVICIIVLLASYIAFIRTGTKPTQDCADEGQRFSKQESDTFQHTCCSGLTEWYSGLKTQIAIGTLCYDTLLEGGLPQGICLRLDDGICGKYENICNSPRDCSTGDNSQFKDTGNFCNDGGFERYCTANLDLQDSELCNLC